MQCKMVHAFFELTDNLMKEQKTPRDYGTGHLLYHSEMDLLDKISRFPGKNVSELSVILNVTKSAVTQNCSKLLEKGLIEKYSEDKNKKEKYFHLTDIGETARNEHMAYHEKSNREMCNYFSSLTDEEKEIIFGFLNKLKELTPFCVFSCNNGNCV